MISVTVEKADDGSLTAKVTVPQGTEAEFVAPAGYAVVSLDGAEAADRPALAPGEHVVKAVLR
jgi:hypothetical protein